MRTTTSLIAFGFSIYKFLLIESRLGFRERAGSWAFPANFCCQSSSAMSSAAAVAPDNGKP